MTHIKQNTSGLYLDIQKIGCFFISCLDIAQTIADRTLTIEAVNRLWDISHSLSYINKDNNVTDSAKIINRTLEYLGSAKKVREVAVFKEGRFLWYKSVDKKDRIADYFIQKITQGGISKTHFRVVDCKGEVIEDPHDPPIRALSVVYSICYKEV